MDGLGTSEHYAKRAAELGQSALALTDHGSLAGVLYHANACQEVGVKAIVGMEAYFRPSLEEDRKNKNPFGYYHLVLLAKNEEGFHNLMKLSSTSYTDDYFYQKPCIDWNLLRKHSKGLIASSSCLSGMLPQFYMQGNTEEAERNLRVFQDIFGDDFYLETQPHDINEQRQVNIELINLAGRKGIPVVATSDVHYPFKGWHDTQEISIMMNTGSSFKKRRADEEAGKDPLRLKIETLWLMSEDELRKTFYEFHQEIPSPFVEEMIGNSQTIADKCEEFIYDKSPKVPKATKNVNEAEQVIRKWCNEGLDRIGKQNDSRYVERMEGELAVISKIGVADYFVIVGDMVRWAKDQGIRVGPGRGSAAGSLVNYLIRITALDPIGYELLFERFLNEYRTEIPDIDIDFQDDRRDEVKQYLSDKWGEEYVVNIAAFQSFGLKGVIQDVSRVMDIPYDKVLKVTKAIPEASKTFGLDLEDIEDRIKQVKEFFIEYPEVKKHSVRLFGQMKGRSKHAAGVIITDRPAADLIPMMRDKEGGVVTQWTERANGQLISTSGFLKIDCLSTNDLTNQQRAIKSIKDRHGIIIDFEDPKQFPFVESPYKCDEQIVKSFANGNNIGVFQFESSTANGMLRVIKPTNIDHVIAVNALNRPGANQIAYDFAKRKNDKVNWKLPHESVGKYLNKTFGFIIYQEQVMQIYSALAKDASDAEAAIFLKVVSKGIARDLIGKQRMQKYYSKFEEGCKEKGIPRKSYELLWEQILQMSTYSFNRSHAAGYAVQAYEDQYLKNKYPLDFYASLLSIETNKIPNIIRESKNFGIKILPPDINISDEGFTIDDNSIRFGLAGIQYVGPAAVEEIKKHRPYESFEELQYKVIKGKVNRRVKLSLLNSGAFDSWGGRDKWMLSEDATERESRQLTIQEKAQLEKETTGFSISRKEDIDLYENLITDTIDNPNLLDEDDRDDVCVGGEIVNVKEIITKKGDKMAFVSLTFKNNDFNLTFFPEKFRKYNHMFGDGNAVLAIGDWDGERQCVVVNNFCTAEQLAMETNGS